MSEIIKGSLEVNHVAGRMTFRVSAGNGDKVKFPITLASDKVEVVIPSYWDGADYIHAGTTRDATTDRTGFTLSKVGMPVNGNPIYLDTRKDPVTVIVYGELPLPKVKQELIALL